MAFKSKNEIMIDQIYLKMLKKYMSMSYYLKHNNRI